MKNKIVLVFLIGIVVWFINRETVIDKLMAVEFPIATTQKSGIQFYDPERYETVDMAEQIEKGVVTLVHLYKTSCRGCTVLNTNIDKLVRFRPDVAVTKIPAPGVANYKATYMGEKLNVKFLPFVMIFDREGKLVASDDGEKHEGFDLFYEWLQEEVDRKNSQLKEDWERKRNS